MKEKINKPPWSSGPEELLKHGLNLLSNDSDTNRRLAMITIDNAVELMIKTYLGLPSRETGLKIPRQKLDEIRGSFPKLLDAIQKFALKKVEGINLSHVEWYHRLRNEVYHEGNGLTVEREKVIIYSEIAKILFNRLFGFTISEPQGINDELILEFFKAIRNIDQELSGLAGFMDIFDITDNTEEIVLDKLFKEDIISKQEYDEYFLLSKLKNRIISNDLGKSIALSREIINQLNLQLEKISEWSACYDDKTSVTL